MRLSELINPMHLSSKAIAHAYSVFQQDAFKSVVLDDFLEARFAAGLLACFQGDGEFRPHHSLKPSDRVGPFGSGENTVSPAVYEASPVTQRLARESLLTGNPSGDAQTAGWLAHTQLLDLVSSTAFQNYLCALTGETDLEDTTYMARTMRFGDLCATHSDAGDGRNLCMLLYVGNGWQPEFGGRFQNVVNGTVARSIDPIGNRLILHRPEEHQIHQVEPIRYAGRQWDRHAYSVWFGVFPAGLAVGPPGSA